MNMSHLDNIRIVLAEPNSEIRSVLVENLRGFGFKSIIPTGNLSRIVNAVRAGEVDLVIADTSLPEGDFNHFVRELRHGREGHNPFLVVITLVDEPSSQAVHAAINSGTDHVLAKPFSPEHLMEKIHELTHARKRFVVTSDYIGPDRRTARRKGTMEVPLIDVPNPLHHRLSGHTSDNHIKHIVDSAKLKINEQMVQRQAYQIGWLLDEAWPELSQVQAGASVEQAVNLQRLSHVASDLCTRLKGTNFAHVAEICLTLERMLGEALDGGLNDADMDLMGRMGEILNSAFDPTRETLAMDYQRRSRALNVFEGDEPKADEKDNVVNVYNDNDAEQTPSSKKVAAVAIS
ncbi:MAG: response regulator [Magnetovibrio sp.]|nr:response regulator [Magnetovibrio sp.]